MRRPFASAARTKDRVVSSLTAFGRADKACKCEVRIRLGHQPYADGNVEAG